MEMASGSDGSSFLSVIKLINKLLKGAGICSAYSLKGRVITTF